MTCLKSHRKVEENLAGFFFFFFFLNFWPYHSTCRTLIRQPGTKPEPPAVEGQSLNQWTAREVPKDSLKPGYANKSWAMHLKDIFSGTTQLEQSKSFCSDQGHQRSKALAELLPTQAEENRLSISTGQQNPNILMQHHFNKRRWKHPTRLGGSL